jgi:hypothetical protein
MYKKIHWKFKLIWFFLVVGEAGSLMMQLDGAGKMSL